MTHSTVSTLDCAHHDTRPGDPLAEEARDRGHFLCAYCVESFNEASQSLDMQVQPGRRIIHVRLSEGINVYAL